VHLGKDHAHCVVVKDNSLASILPSLRSIKSQNNSVQRIAVFGRCNSDAVSKMFHSNTQENDIILYISSDGSHCGENLTNASAISSAFAKWSIDVVHVVVTRGDFQLLGLGFWSHGTASVLRRYVATLEALVKYDVTTLLALHVEVVVKSKKYDIISLCHDPFVASRDFSDVMLSTVYSFTDVYRQLYNLRHVYNVLHLPRST